MKTLIVYGTKYGTVEKCINLLKNKLYGEVVIVNIKKDSIPELTQFNTVIIGGSIYAGQIQKGIKNFCIKDVDRLKNKKLGLFICGMNDKDVETQINNVFPEELTEKAVVKEHFGAEVTFKKMNFFERFIMKKITKSDKDISKISDENISRFANLINK